MTDEGPAIPSKPPEDASATGVTALEIELAGAAETKRAYIAFANKAFEAFDRAEASLVKSFVIDCFVAPALAGIACLAFFTVTSQLFVFLGGWFPALITGWFAGLVFFLPPVLAVGIAATYALVRFRGRRKRRAKLRREAEEAREKVARDLAEMDGRIGRIEEGLKRARGGLTDGGEVR